MTKADEYTYEVTWTENNRGVGILEIFFDDKQIPQSPIRVQVVDRQCDIDYPGQKRENDDSGNCQCDSSTMNIYGRCVESMIMAIVISLGAVCLITVCGVYYVRYRNHKQDQQWLVNVEELQFDDPVEVIGQGSFGVVLLGEYRGTKVALKRALKATSGGSKRGSRRGSRASARKKYGSSRGNSSTGSSGRGSNPTDSVGLSSSGMSSQASSDNEEADLEIGEEQSTGTGSQSSVPSVEAGLGSQSATGDKSSNRNSRSLGFLEEDFGKRHKWGWLFPWLKKDGHSQFKEIILGNQSSGNDLSKKSWHGRWMPCFSAQVRAEEAFIAEMRVLARLRHPNITTVLGAVISSSHDPMLVSKCWMDSKFVFAPHQQWWLILFISSGIYGIWIFAWSFTQWNYASIWVSEIFLHAMLSYYLVLINRWICAQRNYPASQSWHSSRSAFSAFLQASHLAWWSEGQEHPDWFSV